MESEAQHNYRSLQVRTGIPMDRAHEWQQISHPLPTVYEGKWFTHGPMQWAVNELVIKPTYTGAQLLWYKESTEKV
jgi:hypothetical protein